MPETLSIPRPAAVFPVPTLFVPETLSIPRPAAVFPVPTLSDRPRRLDTMCTSTVPPPPDRRATASGRLGPETGSFRFPCPRYHQSCLTLSTTEPAADPTVLDRHTTTPASPSQPHFSLAIHGKAPHSQPRHTSRAPPSPPRDLTRPLVSPYVARRPTFSLPTRCKTPHFQPCHTLQGAPLSPPGQ